MELYPKEIRMYDINIHRSRSLGKKVRHLFRKTRGPKTGEHE